MRTCANHVLDRARGYVAANLPYILRRTCGVPQVRRRCRNHALPSFFFSSSTKTRRKNLPTMVLGNSERNSICLGTL